MGIEEALPIEARKKLRQELLDANDKFILELPKVELHVHIEGTLTPELRWRLAQGNGTPVRLGRKSAVLNSLEDLKKAFDQIQPRPSRDMTNDEERVLFFEAYYEGFEVLKTKEDFFDLAMNYFEHAASMNVRYCEPFFDPQGHTSRGVPWSDMMDGFKEAQIKAEKELNVKSAWTMCFLRDLSPESAMEHYKASLPYRDMIIGIGLDSNEYDRPPSLFEEVFSLARRDGFNITAHCDVGQKDTHDHIRQVASTVAGTGAQRIDHGINAAERQGLIDLIKERGVGMTICPCAYLRHQAPDFIASTVRTLYDAGIQICIASDDPAYMEDQWILHGMLLIKKLCAFTDKDMAVMARHAVNISWATSEVKKQILEEIDSVYAKYHPPEATGGLA